MSSKPQPKLDAPVVITSHMNADFDALAAMVAASKLYKNAVLIFPGSQEKSINSFFINSTIYLYNFHNFKEIDPQTVKTLVVVDTRQRSRIPHVASLLEQDDLEIHTYDHHPATDEDIPSDREIVKPWGSTTAILVDFLKKEDTDLTPDEATLLGLGLYEDTGSFTFSSTTEHDFNAAAWLMPRGMDLNTIKDLLTSDLNADQISILNDLLESATTHDINGVEVVITEISTEGYVADFALLVHKMMDMENIRVLFALGRMQDRVHVVSRSRTPEVDVGQICSSMGGGGHPYAASATVKDRTLVQIKDELFGLLYSQINPQILVRTIMSKPPISIRKKEKIADAAELMTRFGLKALPVLDSETDTCVGIIEHQLADKAVGHGLGQVETREYMMRDFSTASQDTDLYPVMEIILGQRQRLVPIVENQRVVGVVTRTDLINFLVEEPARLPESLLPERRKERNIQSLLRERLPEKAHALLQQAGEVADELHFDLFAVGGFVRDILLRRENLDLDLVVEGDGIVFARTLARKIGGRVRAHEKFKTAVIILEDGQHVDVATARLEYYEHPAALPTVELSSIKMDLYRRDFTINALAVQLNSATFGRLVDFFGGQRDIKEGVIRVLHSLSFVEDPTRILRALRFEKRFHFQIGQHTERLIKNAVSLNMFSRLSGHRIFGEFRLIIEEMNPVSCFKRMEKYNILQSIHPLLKLTPNGEAILEEIEKVLNWYRLLYLEEQPEKWIVYFFGLCAGYNSAQTKLICRRLQFSRRIETSFLDQRVMIQDTVGKLHEWSRGKKLLSELYFILSPLSLEGTLFLMARSRKEDMRRSISLFLTQLRNQKVDITGKDLADLGLATGPVYSEVLQRIMAAKIDGMACDRSAQLKLAERIVDSVDTESGKGRS
ncbi:MAG: CBS domain-containing protein [Desulfovibrionales bacterium]